MSDTANSPEVQEQVKALEARIAKLEDKGDNMTMVLMSGDFDKAFAAFIIANGALAMGKEVTMFVTFWGLDVIKKPTMTASGKKFLEKMVTWMRATGPNQLPTSKMNFAGIGPKLFRYMMGKHNVEGLDSMIEMAMEFGLKIIACQMSMDVMGIKQSDLLDGVDVGGVAAMLNSSYKSNTTLFI